MKVQLHASRVVPLPESMRLRPGERVFFSPPTSIGLSVSLLPALWPDGRYRSSHVKRQRLSRSVQARLRRGQGLKPNGKPRQVAGEEQLPASRRCGANSAAPDDLSEGPIELWTTTCDYAATGEGRHLFVRIAPACSRNEATKAFEDDFGKFFAMDCVADRGVCRNAVAAYLFNDELLSFMKDGVHRGLIELSAHLHFNFS